MSLDLRHIARRAGRLVRTVRHAAPLTLLGALTAGLGYWLTTGYGASEHDVVLRSAGLVAVVVVGVALGLVVVGTARVWLGVRRAGPGEDLHLDSGLTVSSGLRLPCLARWPLVQVRLLWEAPARVDVELIRRGGQCHEQITPRLRGVSAVVARRLVVEDIFGFARWGIVVVRRPHKIRVTPRRTTLTGHVITHFLGGDALSHPSGPQQGEMIEMRRYVYGDPLRHVLWKAFARSRKLLVRSPERAVAPLPSAVAYLVAGPGDEPVAGAARFFIEEGLLGHSFIFGADGAAAPSRTADEALDQIVLSSRARAEGGSGLRPFLGQLTREQRTACMLFIPPRPGPWLPALEAAASRMPGARAITALDEDPLAAPPSRLHELLFARRDRSARAVRELSRVLRRLSSAGLDVHVLHRASGELLDRAQLRRLVEADA